MNYKYTNQLINENSPYLLQHSHNPVNWYAWNNETFNKAREEDKPIFLSIGYSTCHWCHVMERESFEDIDVANILNKNFVCIKVDREERPDIDSIYMSFCQMITGEGGWPLTIFMTSEQKPFYAGTYFPKSSDYSRIGLIELLGQISEAWTNNRKSLLSFSNNITNIIQEDSKLLTNQKINNTILDTAFKNLTINFDNTYKGFGTAPKFPMPTNLYFLMRYYHSNNNKKVLDMVTDTLEHIYRGGIYDHIGFGFSRYSTDEKWLVPHFEKMLYDNALLSIVYTEAYQITNNNLFKKIANDTLNYVLRDMTSPDGGFYSAEDADSEGEEGKFYVWSYDEIINVLGEKDGIGFCEQYNVTPSGNFKGKNILNLITSKDLYPNDILIQKLFDYRKKKIPPYKDDKILTAWNGLMIVALSISGRVFKTDRYIEASKKAVSFIFDHLFNANGRLLARYRDGKSSFFAYAEDYAFLIWGLIELYESTFDSQYLQKALFLNEQLIKYFWDKQTDGLFLYGSDSEQLILKPKELYDGVMPSSNSVSIMNWLRLSNLTGNTNIKEYAIKTLSLFASEINSNPSAYPYLLSAYMFLIAKTKEIVIVGEKDSLDTKKMINLVNEKYNPYMTVLMKDIKTDILLKEIVSFVSDYTMIDNKTTAYICSDKVCSKPVSNITEFKAML